MKKTKESAKMENLTTPAGAHNRLQPIRGYLFKKGLTMSELSRRCQHKLSRGGVGYRVRVGDCMMADMADMAEAAGYKFVWHWENVRPVEPSPRAVRLPNKLHSELLRPVLTYLFEKNISVPDLAKKCGISGPGMAFRIREGVCMMSQMEEMADAAGYKFVWSWEEIPEETTAAE